jgi:hypothetical protein
VKAASNCGVPRTSRLVDLVWLHGGCCCRRGALLEGEGPCDIYAAAGSPCATPCPDRKVPRRGVRGGRAALAPGEMEREVEAVSYLSRRPNIEARTHTCLACCLGSAGLPLHTPHRCPAQILEMNTEYTEFELTKSDASMANSLRRVPSQLIVSELCELGADSQI